MISTHELSRARTSHGNGFPPVEPPHDFGGGGGGNNNHKDRRQQIQEARENGQLFRQIGIYTVDAVTEPYVRLSARAKANQTPDRSFDISRRLILVQKRSKVDSFTQKHITVTESAGATIIALSAFPIAVLTQIILN